MRKKTHKKSGRSPFAIEPLESRQLLSACVIDLLVAYTTSAKTSAGGLQAIQNQISKAVADANQVLANSLIDFTLRLVDTEEVSYTESGSLATDLGRLQDPTDGFLDTIPSLRDTFGADLVSLFVAGGDQAGISYLMDDPDASTNADYAFSVVKQDAAAGPNYTLIHEIGHNLGADHDRENASNTGAYDYSYGYRFLANGTIYRDVMAYDPGTRIPYFSNPNITYLGVPIGIAAGSSNSADASRTLNQTAPIVAAFRDSVITDSSAPIASISNYNFTTSSQILSFSIKYTDDTALDTTTFGGNDIRVTGPNNLNQLATFLGVDQVTPGGVRVATYQVSIGSGLLAQGTYTLNIQSNQIADTSGNLMPSTALTLDTISPAATENAAGITSEIGPNYTFTVTYADNDGIDLSTLDSDDLHVTGPFGYDHPALLIGATDNGDSITVTYRITSDYTSWDGAENGSYSIVMQPNQVKDVNGNTIAPGSIGSFEVAIAGGTFATALDLSMIAGAKALTDSVDATDTTDFFKFSVGARSTVTIALTNLLGDANMLLVDDANNNGNADEGEILAFPNLLGVLPETISTTLDPGTYYLWLYRVSGTTSYSLAFAVTALAGTPTAAVNISSLATAPGGAYSTFSLTYADDTAIKISTIGDDDLLISGPNGFSSTVTLVSVTNQSDGPLRGATYRLDAPGGVWDPSDNGAYTISMQANQVSDTGNVFVAQGALGTFAMNLHDTTAPTATLSAPSPVDGTSMTTFTITYSDNFAVKLASLDSADIQITGPNSFSQTATFTGANQLTNSTTLIARYRINAPGGAWDSLDSGTYTISMRAGQVSDISMLPIPTSSLGTFSVNIADTLAPSALLDAPTMTAPATNYTFTITYSDNVAINLSTLDSSDITVSGPGGFSQNATYIGPNTTGNGSPRIATYRIVGPGGAWDLLYNGEYSVTLNNAQVADTTGNTVAAGLLGTFSVAIADTAAPMASASAQDLAEEGGSTYQFTITWSDNLLIDVSSLDSSDLVIVGPDSSLLPVTLVGVDSNIDAATIIATYALSAPGGIFQSADNGTYAIQVLADEVADSTGNFAAANTMAIFHINIDDITPPTATLTPIANITNAGGQDLTFTVTYSDDVAVSNSSLDNNDIIVIGPRRFSQLATLLSVDDNSNGSPRVATYKITAPGGTWNAIDRGTYKIALQSTQVSDISGNSAGAGLLGQFAVTIPDLTLPTATLQAAKVISGGATVYRFKVVYRDDVGVLASSIGNGDIRVTAKGFSQVAKLVSRSTTKNSGTITAVYKITPPGGFWNRADNKKYTVTLLANQIFDTSANASFSRILGTFTVAIS